AGLKAPARQLHWPPLMIWRFAMLSNPPASNSSMPIVAAPALGSAKTSCESEDGLRKAPVSAVEVLGVLAAAAPVHRHGRWVARSIWIQRNHFSPPASMRMKRA